MMASFRIQSTAMTERQPTGQPPRRAVALRATRAGGRGAPLPSGRPTRSSPVGDDGPGSCILAAPWCRGLPRLTAAYRRNAASTSGKTLTGARSLGDRDRRPYNSAGPARPVRLEAQDTALSRRRSAVRIRHGVRREAGRGWSSRWEGFSAGTNSAGEGVPGVELPVGPAELAAPGPRDEEPLAGKVAPSGSDCPLQGSACGRAAQPLRPQEGVVAAIEDVDRVVGDRQEPEPHDAQAHQPPQFI